MASGIRPSTPSACIGERAGTQGQEEEAYHPRSCGAARSGRWRGAMRAACETSGDRARERRQTLTSRLRKRRGSFSGAGPRSSSCVGGAGWGERSDSRPRGGDIATAAKREKLAVSPLHSPTTERGTQGKTRAAHGSRLWRPLASTRQVASRGSLRPGKGASKRTFKSYPI